MLERYCERLAKEWEVPRGFATSVPGLFVIPLGDDLEINLNAIDAGFTMVSTLGDCPTVEKAEFYVKLLEGNMLGQFTKGATLGLDQNDKVVVSLYVKEAPQFQDFFDTLEDFIDTVDTWKAMMQIEAKK